MTTKNTMRMKSKKSSEFRRAVKWFSVPLFAVILAIIINNFLIISAIVPSESMADTIEKGTLVVASRLAYVNDTPKRGDIVIFQHPEIDEKYVIKRIIALPGETVELRSGRVYINGILLTEDYITSYSTDNFSSVTVPNGEYFILGDNRKYSTDSRYLNYPFVKLDDIFAKANLSLFPKFQSFK